MEEIKSYFSLGRGRSYLLQHYYLGKEIILFKLNLIGPNVSNLLAKHTI